MPEGKKKPSGSVPTNFADKGWSRAWGIFKIPEFLGRCNFLWEEFKQTLKSKNKTHHKKRSVWSWSSPFFPQSSTHPKKKKISFDLLYFLSPVWVLPETNKCHLRRRVSIEFQYHNTRNIYTKMGDKGNKKKSSCCFLCPGNCGSKNVKHRRSLCKRPATTALMLHVRT